MANKPCKDCIHKEACITANPDMVKKTYQCNHFKSSADVVEVKHGKWIRKGNEKKCSVCGFIYYSNNDEWNGCPNCLAKMDGGKAE